MNPSVTYTIEVKADNADVIDKINKILLGSEYGRTSTTESASNSSSKPATSKPAPAAAQDDAEDTGNGTTASAVKAAAKAAKGEHGTEFINAVFDELDVPSGPIVKRLKELDKDQYDEAIQLLKAGPQTKAAADEDDGLDEDEDDGLDDDSSDDAIVTADAVKDALKAYSKENGRDEAKALMSKHKVTALSGVDKLNDKQLAALMKELV